MSVAADPAPRATAAAQSRVLRRLYLALMFRGKAGAGGRRRLLTPGVTFAISLGSFMLLGLLALTFYRLPLFAYAASLHALTFLMVSIHLAATSANVLFSTEEADVLLHRPIQPGALLAAKVRVIVLVTLTLAVALNACGLILGATRSGGTWTFIPAHLVSVAAEVLFCASVVVLAYGLCLRWFGRERLEGLMTTVQVVIAIGAMVGGQIVPRMMMHLDAAVLSSAPVWLALLPPAWFAALDAVLCAPAKAEPRLLGLAGLGLVATGLATWIGVRRLAGTYEQGLVMLNEAGPGSVKPGGKRGRRVSAMLRLPLIGAWLRDPVERAAFRLTLAGLGRARGVKLRVYPVLGQLLVCPLIIFLTGPRGGPFAGYQSYLIAFAGAFVAMLPALVMDRLRMAEDWRATELFHQAPLASAAALFHGTRKAVILALCVPGLVLVTVLGLVFLRRPIDLLLLAPGVIAVPLFSLLPGLGRLFVPFAEPPEVQMKDMLGCVFMMLFTLASMVLGGLAGWAWSTGWFGWLLAGEAGIVVALAALLRRLIARRVLRAES
jgi:hypothetical protein